MNQVDLNSLYVMVGILIVSNLGAIGALIAFIFKAGMFVADTKAGIKAAKESGDRAHKRIDKHHEVYHT